MTTESTSAQHKASEVACRLSVGHVNQVHPKLPLLKILHAAGANGETFTLKEVMHYLGQYIMIKQLYDKKQQHMVHCENDPLGELLGIQSFSVKDPSLLYNMLRENLTAAPLKDAAQTLCLAKDLNTDTLNQEQQKFTFHRKAKEVTAVGRGLPPESHLSSTTVLQPKSPNSEEAEGDIAESHPQSMNKHPRLELVFEEWDVDGLPWWFVGNLRSNYGYRSNGSTDLPSNKNGDTAVASDTTDDLWFLSESDNERFNLAMKADTVDSDSSTDIDEDGKENGKKVLQDEANEEDLEDTQSLSDDTDIDIVSEDCWQCTKCKKLNSPEKRYCFRCWALRKDWYSDCPKLLHSVSTPNITATKGKKEEEDEGIDIPECRRTVSDPVNRTADQNKLSEKNQTGPRSSIESLDLTQCNPSTASSPSCKKKTSKPSLGLPAALPESNKELLKPCCVCHRRPRNGNIIHGKTAHLVTCFLCARMLQKFKSPCPMCRQPINLVIKIFVA